MLLYVERCCMLNFVVVARMLMLFLLLLLSLFRVDCCVNSKCEEWEERGGEAMKWLGTEYIR